MSAKTPAPRKSCSIPGYAGYRPQVKANNHIQKTVTEQSRSVFNKTIDFSKNAFSSTGFNAKLIPQKDDTRESLSRRYGAETRHKPHPLHHPSDYFTTTTRASFVPPKLQPHPTFTARGGSARFENKARLTFTKLKGQSGFGEDTHFHKEAMNSLASGYTANRQNWDGSGWGTEKNTHTDQMRTTYRNGFNCPKPFHKPDLRNNDGRFKRKQNVFDVADK